MCLQGVAKGQHQVWDGEEGKSGRWWGLPQSLTKPSAESSLPGTHGVFRNRVLAGDQRKQAHPFPSCWHTFHLRCTTARGRGLKAQLGLMIASNGGQQQKEGEPHHQVPHSCNSSLRIVGLRVASRCRRSHSLRQPSPKVETLSIPLSQTPTTRTCPLASAQGHWFRIARNIQQTGRSNFAPV